MSDTRTGKEATPTPKGRVWLVTGASSGFGYEVTKCALSKGDSVVVATRHTDSDALTQLSKLYPRPRLLLVKTNVTSLSDIQHAFAQAKQVYGRLDVVFSNAGFTMLAEAEGTPEEDARRLFEVNFWGSLHVIQEAVKFFRDVNPPAVGGRIIQNSSVSALYCFPGQGIYTASKHAIEGVTETLASELDPAWNIKITLLQPALFDTPARTTNLVIAPVLPAYVNTSLPSIQTRQFVSSIPFTGDPEKGGRAIYRLSELADPPLRLPLGKDAVRLAREKLAMVGKNVDEYESWSDNLEFDTIHPKR
ncbi:unnamed protein product [Somion occarium]|uniref:NAD(P)-binding protein n=1 Tax=Somion occarium TaxID=3059160 RepID=A0ABP1DVZ8_9APHY